MDTAHELAMAAGALAVIVGIWLIVAWLRGEDRPPYTRRPSLLTAAELRFYQVLLQAVPPGLAVFVKVRLMDLVSVPDDAWREHGAPGSGMHVDFVLADASGIVPRLVIELDDRSHARPEARERDAFKDKALEAAGLPLVRVRAARRYDVADLRERIKGAAG